MSKLLDLDVPTEGFENSSSKWLQSWMWDRSGPPSVLGQSGSGWLCVGLVSVCSSDTGWNKFHVRHPVWLCHSGLSKCHFLHCVLFTCCPSARRSVTCGASSLVVWRKLFRGGHLGPPDIVSNPWSAQEVTHAPEDEPPSHQPVCKGHTHWGTVARHTRGITGTWRLLRASLH